MATYPLTIGVKSPGTQQPRRVLNAFLPEFGFGATSEIHHEKSVSKKTHHHEEVAVIKGSIKIAP